MGDHSILCLRVKLPSVHIDLPRSFDLCNLVAEFEEHKIKVHPHYHSDHQDDYYDEDEVNWDDLGDDPHHFSRWIQRAFRGLNSAYDVAADDQYLTAGGTVNAKCFRTMEVEVTEAGHRSIRSLNQGHFGVNGCYEGARRPRSGFIETFKDCKYEQTYLTRRPNA